MLESASERGLQELCKIGVALSVEKDIDKLLELIVSVARQFTNAEGCTLYLYNEQQDLLEFSVVQNEKLQINKTAKGEKSDWAAVQLYLPDGKANHHSVSAHCAHTGKPINISDVYHENGYDFSATREYDAQSGYHSKSMLIVPMQDNQGNLVGVLQLLNCRQEDGGICPFSESLVELVMGLASQASVAVVNVRLIDRLKRFTSLAVALSAEKNLGVLLNMIADISREYTMAEGCTIYLMDREDKNLEFAVVQNEKLDTTCTSGGQKRAWPPIPLYDDNDEENHRNVSAYCALKKKTVEISDVYHEKGYDFSGTRAFDEKAGYRSKSMLLVPMTDHENEVIGVLQLLNARRGVSKKVQDFAADDIRMVQGLASQAAVAVSNVRLVEDIESLLKSFVKCIAAAIDEKSPYTAGHIQRVAELTELMAREINRTESGALGEISFSEEQLEEISMAAWMHDIGKIATPEYVVDKATKLETIFDRIELIRHRLEIVKRDREIARLKELLCSQGFADQCETSEVPDIDLDEALSFLERVNTGGEFMTDEDLEGVEKIAGYYYELGGEKIPLLSEEEASNCAIRRGTLTEEEREVINHHIVVTIKMLESLPFLKKWRRVPEIAGMHHEKLDGSGYPKNLKEEEINLEGRILAVADVFEALTAADRPYKLGKPLSQAIKILGFMVKDHHLDESVCDFLINSGIVTKYAEKHLPVQQIDTFAWNGQEFSGTEKTQ
ncbi:MAG: HD domain-containing phosphohydrolase [Thermodesulfobacteriota bacterium]